MKIPSLVWLCRNIPWNNQFAIGSIRAVPYSLKLFSTGIFARDLVATSGRNDDSIALLDSYGCSIDRSIFPSLRKISHGKALMGKFEAFKFADDTVVRFQVTVQFCLHECPLPTCNENSSPVATQGSHHELDRSRSSDLDHPREHNFRDSPHFQR